MLQVEMNRKKIRPEISDENNQNRKNRGCKIHQDDEKQLVPEISDLDSPPPQESALTKNRNLLLSPQKTSKM